MLKYSLYILMAVIMFFEAAVELNAYQVTIASDEYKTEHYSVSDGSCSVKLEVYHDELNKGIICNRTVCNYSIKFIANLYDELLKTILKNEKGVEQFHTLFWRRLYQTDALASNDLSKRLSIAALKSSKWDQKAGKLKDGNTIADIANEAKIYQELSDVFAKNGFNLSMTSTEKSLVANAGNLPFFKELQEHGATSEDKLPFDCLTWFSISVLK